MAEIKKIRNTSEGLDEQGNVVHSEVIVFDQDQETIHDLSVENDGSNVVVGGPTQRPKNPR